MAYLRYCLAVETTKISASCRTTTEIAWRYAVGHRRIAATILLCRRVEMTGIRMANVDQPAGTEIESEVRDFVRRDFTVARRRHVDTSVDSGVENLHTLIHRVSGVSIGEIERVIGELQAMRDRLREAGDRAQREITAYADVSHAAMASVQAIADNLSRWKTTASPDHEQVRPEAS
jgi:hypothetical protein